MINSSREGNYRTGRALVSATARDLSSPAGCCRERALRHRFAPARQRLTAGRPLADGRWQPLRQRHGALAPVVVESGRSGTIIAAEERIRREA
ncbi:MAG TPA: hypothetical protein DIT03_12805 [Candidatus Accumulibacter sp.]|nr:hypothetical protein [Accumulibacter sp.]